MCVRLSSQPTAMCVTVICGEQAAPPLRLRELSGHLFRILGFADHGGLRYKLCPGTLGASQR